MATTYTVEDCCPTNIPTSVPPGVIIGPPGPPGPEGPQGPPGVCPDCDDACPYCCPIFCDNGTPEGVIEAPVGAIYEQQDAAITTHSGWWKRSGVGNTGWRRWVGLGGEAAGSLAIGDNSVASGVDSIAFGENTTASGLRSSAIGKSTTASGEDSKAWGAGAQATARASIAIGVDTLASAVGAIALGNTAKAVHLRSIAIGDTETEGEEEINIGINNINVSAFAGLRDIMIGQAISVGGLHSGSGVFIGDSVELHSSAAFGSPVYIGVGVFGADAEGVIIGSGARANLANSPVAGLDPGTVSVIIGEFAEGNGDCIVAVGHDAIVRSDFSVALGPHARAGEDQTTSWCNALGRLATARGNRSTAIGGNSLVAAAHSGSIALGYLATTDGSNQLMIGAATQQITSIRLNGGPQILTTQQAAIADSVGGDEVAKINAILGALRTHGLIAA